MNARAFFDTNVIVYAFALGDLRRERAEELLAAGGVVSVQVLNEYVNVSLRKRKRAWDGLLAELDVINQCLETVPLVVATHREALDIARRHGLTFYDSLVVAAAQQSGCRRLYSEDMHHGQTIGGVTILNPFLSA